MRRSSLDNTSRSPAAWICLLLPLVVGLSADLLSKQIAFDRLTDRLPQTFGSDFGTPSEIYRFWPGILHFQAHVNYGAVFGIGQGARALFIAVSFLAIGLLGYLFLKSGRQRFYQVLLGMLLAGVLGNLYDRVFFGYVRDLLYAFPGRQWSDLYSALPNSEIFPWIFNVADSLLCTGVGGMFLLSAFSRDDGRKTDRNTPPADLPLTTQPSSRPVDRSPPPAPVPTRDTPHVD